jgi:hypothetical protein
MVRGIKPLSVLDREVRSGSTIIKEEGEEAETDSVEEDSTAEEDSAEVEASLEEEEEEWEEEEEEIGDLVNERSVHSRTFAITLAAVLSILILQKCL